MTTLWFLLGAFAYGLLMFFIYAAVVVGQHANERIPRCPPTTDIAAAEHIAARTAQDASKSSGYLSQT